MAPTSAQPVEADTTVGQRGRIILPVAVQQAADLTPGDRVHIRVLETGAIVIETTKSILNRICVPNPDGNTRGTDMVREERRRQAESEGERP
ncbi:AbrB/MazE/SpoVT family DNA-binding domain-containing protein [Kitasatospora sp. NBC_01266]|uniref:AbrB/MazE/SpoVT family DNA-binding domain-containing protein n=1 Tax=Kitasatospora sp. NBC_01266 TaxID=2903572 RepID=UPI002E32E709|nr:AbrB/MazE/SpoVT family DNA-binding domain-containing protein [Kitasatospora sp. NBC_01266]